VQDLGRPCVAKRGIRLGEGAGVVVGPLGIFVIAHCSHQQHPRILEEVIDQSNYIVGHPVFITFHVGADPIDQRLGIGDMLWAFNFCCRATEPYGEGSRKKRQHRHVARRSRLHGRCASNIASAI
jgi:hypothetical protein